MSRQLSLPLGEIVVLCLAFSVVVSERHKILRKDETRMFSDRTNWKLTHNRFTQALDEVRAAGAMVHDLTASNPTRAGLHYYEAAIVKALASPLSRDYHPQRKRLPTAREAG